MKAVYTQIKINEPLYQPAATKKWPIFFFIIAENSNFLKPNQLQSQFFG